MTALIAFVAGVFSCLVCGVGGTYVTGKVGALILARRHVENERIQNEQFQEALEIAREEQRQRTVWAAMTTEGKRLN